MKKFAINIYILLGIFIVGFIVGSFVDLQLSQAIFMRNDTFGLVLSAIGTTPGYGCIAIIGGSFFSIGLLRKDYKLWMRILFYGLAVVAYAVAVFFAGREFFGPNGFYQAAPDFVGYLIELPIMGGLGYLGFRIGKYSDNNNLWLLLVILMIAIFVALVPGVTILKEIFHRPRYRMITEPEVMALDYVSFHSWWQRCADYKDIMAKYSEQGIEVLKEQFKSFPSGHAGATAVLILYVTFLPLMNKKYERLQLPLFYSALVWCLLICASRIWVGAHFLSDVSMGGLLTVICLLIAYYVVMNNKKLAPQEEKPVETTKE